MTSANDIQIGGEHYKNAGPQHWDVIDEYRVPYLEGCASKYMLRHHNKNGKQDLEKAWHFCIKISEQAAREPYGIRASTEDEFPPEEIIEAMMDGAGLKDTELRLGIRCLLGPMDKDQANLIAGVIQGAIVRLYPD